MKKVALLDTSIATDNLGDGIIMDAVRDVVSDVLPDAYCVSVPTHDFMGPKSRQLVQTSAFSILGGTNILQSKMLNRGSLWKLSPLDYMSLKSVILLGVGWRGYQSPLTASSRWLLGRILDGGAYHSVRDQYTADKLAAVSDKVLNTACMTMWPLTPEVCQNLPRKKADQVVTTLTYYRPKPEIDRKMLETLARRYKTVHFWPQQSDDLQYFQSLGVPGIEVMPAHLAAYNKLLDNEEVDFIGARLHGGVRAMQKGHRALIVAVDNRAVEISRDTGLPIMKHGEIDPLEPWIDAEAETKINLPQAAIDLWKSQFKPG